MTWNPADKSANAVLSAGNTTLNATDANIALARGNSGLTTPTKRYFEIVIGTMLANVAGGIGTALAPIAAGNGVGASASWGLYNDTGNLTVAGDGITFAATGVTPANGDVVGVAVDGSNIYLSYNGTFYLSSGASGGSTPTTATFTSSSQLFPMANTADSAATQNIVLRDTGSFSFLPSGYSAWATSGTVNSGAGAGAGVGAAAAIGAPRAAGLGAAAGVGAASATGRSIASGVGSASGLGGAAAIAAGASVAQSSASGVATGVGRSISSAIGVASGLGAASASATQQISAIGTASGTGSASGISNDALISSAVGSASGMGSASAEGFSTSLTLTPAERIVQVAPEIRMVQMPAEIRIVYVEADHREAA